MKNLFLTGRRHVGKTTLLQEIITSWKGRVGGFAVERAQNEMGEPIFQMVNLMTLERAPIAVCTAQGWLPRPSTFDVLGASAVLSAVETASLVVMDELGFFERDARVFQAVVLQALSSEVPVLGVLKFDSNQFLRSIKERADVKVLELRENNRGEVRRELSRWAALWGDNPVRMGPQESRMV